MIRSSPITSLAASYPGNTVLKSLLTALRVAFTVSPAKAVLVRGLCFAVCIAQLIAIGVQTYAADPIHIAVVVSGEPTDIIDNAEAILSTAVLPDDPRVRPVERQKLDAVLTEQRLVGLMGLGEASTVSDRVVLGRLLDADLLLILSPGDRENAVRVVVSETQLGLRLHEAGLTVDDEALVEQGKGLLDDILRLYAEPIREIIAVPPFTSDDFTFEYDARRRIYAELAASTARQLPGVVTADLEEARAIGRELTIRGERSLTRPQPLYLHGRYATADDDTVTITLRLTRGERVIHESQLPPATAGGAVQPMRRAVHDLLQRETRSKGELAANNSEMPLPNQAAKDEARHLMARARQAHRLGYFEDALSLSRAAVLLNPEDQGMRRFVLQSFANAYRKDGGEWMSDRVPTAWRQRVREIAPFYEAYLMQNRVHDGLSHPFLTALDYPSSSALMLRVMRHKAVHAQHEPTHDLLERLLDHAYPRSEHGGEAMAQTLLEAAKHWPDLGDYKNGESRSVARLINFYSRYAGRDRTVMRKRLEQLAAAPGRFTRPAAEEMLANLDRGVWVHGRPYHTASKPKPVEPVPTTHRAQLTRISLPIFKVYGWIPTVPGEDAAWGEPRGARHGESVLMRIGGDRRPEILAEINGSYRNPVCFDGRYLWAALRDDQTPRVVAFDLPSGQRHEFTPEHGLPNEPIEHFAVASVEPGRVLVVATIGSEISMRTWIGWMKIDNDQTLRTEILHTAREHGGRSVNRGFRAAGVWGFPTAGPGGTPRFIIRRYPRWLIFDPEGDPVFRIIELPRFFLPNINLSSHDSKIVSTRHGGPDQAHPVRLEELVPDTLEIRTVGTHLPEYASAFVMPETFLSIDFKHGISTTPMHSDNPQVERYHTQSTTSEFPFGRGAFRFSHHYGVVFLRGMGDAFEVRLDGEPIALTGKIHRLDSDAETGQDSEARQALNAQHRPTLLP